MGGTGNLSSAEAYDPASGAFSFAGNLSGPRVQHLETLVADGHVLVVGGTSNFTDALTTAELFTSTDPPFQVEEFSATANMNAVRRNPGIALLPNGRALVTGGSSLPPGSGGAQATAELYDPAANAGAGAFSLTGSMNVARHAHSSTPLPNGLVLIAAGMGVSNVLASAELYNPATGTFTSTGSMANARRDHTATLLPNGRVLITGGSGLSAVALNSAELFDPTANGGRGRVHFHRRHERGSPKPHGHAPPTGRVLVAGGGDGITTALASAEIFDPAANAGAGAFVLTGNMNAARAGAAAVLLPTGRVLVAGGLSASSAVLASAELFDPAGGAGAGAFTFTGSMSHGLAGGGALLGPNGRAFVGGFPSFTSPAQLEVYEPTSGTFGPPLGTVIPRLQGVNAVLLANGNALIVGGFNGVNVLSSAELYQFGAIRQLTDNGCAIEPGLRSLNSDNPTSIRFVNNSSQTIQVFWRNFDGQRVFYFSLNAGQSQVQLTFITHPWVITNTTGTCLATFIPIKELAPAIFQP